jgi:sucrose-6-phosphate hydrolase SacC (GH32 family)
VFKMWYSGDDNYEPQATGYATSPDGLTWTKQPRNPILAADPKVTWDYLRAMACQVARHADWYVMFYAGLPDIQHSQIDIARSRDGITNWQRHPANAIIRPGKDKFDASACCKPYAIFDGQKWLLW